MDTSEAPQVEMDDCGAGRGAECCAYLVMQPGRGTICGRETALAPVLRSRVAEGTMKAQRLPVEPIPECQVFRTEEVAT